MENRARIAGVVTESIVDGPGIRSGVFFQGCPHCCDGCHNPETWDPGAGTEVTLEELLPLLQITPLVGGVTFSGGEPFLQAAFAFQLGVRIKKAGLNLWVYTGFKWEELLQNRECFGALLSITDVLVDGKFQKEAAVAGLAFRGSSNQRIIRVAPSLEEGRVIEWRPETAVF